jgi:hypothetical protein
MPRSKTAAAFAIAAAPLAACVAVPQGPATYQAPATYAAPAAQAPAYTVVPDPAVNSLLQGLGTGVGLSLTSRFPHYARPPVVYAPPLTGGYGVVPPATGYYASPSYGVAPYQAPSVQSLRTPSPQSTANCNINNQYLPRDFRARCW